MKQIVSISKMKYSNGCYEWIVTVGLTTCYAGSVHLKTLDSNFRLTYLATRKCNLERRLSEIMKKQYQGTE